MNFWEYRELINQILQENDCSYAPEVIAVISRNSPADYVRAYNQAESAGYCIMDYRESEFVKPGRIFWLCFYCGKEF